jgi:trigger factor
VQTSQQQAEQFQSDHIQATLTRQPGCLVRIEVTLDSFLTKEAHDSAVKDVRKEVSIPGFRKGKVPYDVVCKNFASAIDRQFRDILLRSAFHKTLELTKLRPFGQNAVKRSELKKYSLDEGAQCLFSLEVEPETPQIDINSIETKPQEPRQITEKEIERGYKQLRVMYADWQEVQDRPIQIGDFAEIDIDVIQHPAHNICTNQLVHVEKDELPRWLLDALQGMNIDETKEAVASSQPDDPRHLFVQDDNAPSKQCLIVVKKIKTATLAAEDEAFVQKFGAKSVEELKQQLFKRIKDEESQYIQEVARYNLRRELLQKYPIDLPHSLLEAEIRGRIAFCKSGQDISQGSLPSDQKETELRQRIEAETRGFFGWMHLLRPITSLLQTTITQAELQDEFQQQMKLPRLHRLIYPGLTPEDVRNRLVMLIMMRKCEDYLLSRGTGHAQNESNQDKTV